MALLVMALPERLKSFGIGFSLFTDVDGSRGARALLRFFKIHSDRDAFDAEW